MPITYNSPGVYREDVVIKTKNSLPTGVPVFIGFADEADEALNAGKLSLETRVALAAESAGDLLPNVSNDTPIWYDATNTCLVCAGPMSVAHFTQTLQLFPDGVGQSALKQLYRNSQKKLNQPVALYRKAEFQLYFNTLPFGQSYLVDAVNGFFDNGGVYCYVVHVDATDSQKEALINAIDKGLSLLSDIDLVAVPDCMVLKNTEDVQAVQRKALAHCTIHANRFALLDSYGPLHIAQEDPKIAIRKQRLAVIDMSQLGPDPSGISTWTIDPSANGALYFPWIYTLDSSDKPIPPCGHIAGIYARSDKKGGVSRAPANEEILGVVDLERTVTSDLQDEFNPEGINCLRAFPGRGIRVWGARTLCQDSSFLYINVRRLFLTVSRWIDMNLAWASFEPNTPLLWVRISRELTVFLTKLWKSGALCGDRPDQAFFVKCDNETNSAEIIDIGEVVTQIGLAPMVPAEFIVLRVIHHAGTTEIT